MSSPEDEPLGGKPVLPPPSREARERAHPLFNRILSERTTTTARAPAPQRDDEATRVAHDPFPRTSFDSGRRYDATLAFIQATAGPITAMSPPPERHAPAYSADDSVDAAIDAHELARLEALSADPSGSRYRPAPVPVIDETTNVVYDPEVHHVPRPAAQSAGDDEVTLARRPPPFAPMVRPSPPKRTGPAQVDEASLSAMVDTSMLVASPDGSASFEIAFDHEVFNNLACSITVTPAGVVATFKVEDANTRRLLEAEAGRLRVQLADRGLKVADVRVEQI